MELQKILEILTNKYTNLSQARTSAVNSGDLTGVMKIDEDISSTKISIQQIQTMLANDDKKQ